MEYKAISTPTSVDGRVVSGFAAIMGNVDAYGDIIHPGAFRKTIQENRLRLRHLWQHDSSSPPVAVIREIAEVGASELPGETRVLYPDALGGLMVVREYLDTPRGNEILTGIISGAITEMSIGYDAIKADMSELDSMDGKLIVRNLREIRLWDTSDVNWGANSATIAQKIAVPFRDTGIADEGAEWNAPILRDFTDQSWDELSDAERRRVAAHFAWVSGMPPERYGDCKLPHHMPGTTGIGRAVWRGVSAAMAALMGARGGVDIPDGDVEAVYRHLARHYAQFDREPPELKLVQWMRMSHAVPELKIGRVLSSRNLERLKSALEVLNEILLAAEPQDEELALTEAVMRRLQIALRDPIIIDFRRLS